LIGSEPRSHKLFAPILVFLSQIDRLWSKLLWQLSVHFRHPRRTRIKKTDFTRQVITRTVSKINIRNSVCEWKLVDSTYEGGPKNNWNLNVARELEVVARCAARCRESTQHSSSLPRGVSLGWVLLLLWLFF
jgi:hypothetical protein